MPITKHGLSNPDHELHGLYKTWKDMRHRCYNPRNKRFHHYGGRGIKICKRWDRFENFRKDMGDDWKLGMTLDRKNPDKDYKPSNCQWLTKSANTAKGNMERAKRRGSSSRWMK